MLPRRLQLLSLLLVVVGCGVGDAGRGRGRNRNRYRAQRIHGIQLVPTFTGFDCAFGADEDCLWTWEKDTFEPGSFDGREPNASWPGQHGFYRMSGLAVEKYFKEAEALKTTFFGPGFSRDNGDRGEYNKRNIQHTRT